MHDSLYTNLHKFVCLKNILFPWLNHLPTNETKSTVKIVIEKPATFGVF